jgi:glycosyltransferase involved in cell wall biosynthesis
MLCSIVIPVYNEEGNIVELVRSLTRVLSSIAIEYEIIFVDDGSSDKSLDIIKELSSSDGKIYYLSFTRNFGHEAASTAGLEAAHGDCLILMDADLQDTPELIPEMIGLWREGYHLVYAKRRKRYGESFFKRITAKMFYQFLNLLSDSKIPIDTGDFRLMDRAVVNNFLKCREYNRFVRGLTAWVGYTQIGIEFDRPERYAGETKYNPIKLLLLSLDVITGFSITPLRIITGTGFTIAALSMLLTSIVVVQKLFFNLRIPGYAFLASGLFFLGGIQLFFLGVIGEYIGRIYRQVQQRPLYLIKEQNLHN